METSLVSTAAPLWVADASSGSAKGSAASESSNALDRLVESFGQIAEGLFAKSAPADMRADTLFDPNGAPQLQAPDQPSTPAVVAETPLHLGLLISEGMQLNLEGSHAKMNGGATADQEQLRSARDKLVETQLGSIKKFEQKSAELDEKAGRWYNRLASWAAENLGPYMPYIGLAVAAVAMIATAGAAWPMLAMAGLSMANHVLKSFDIDVVGAVTKAIKVLGPLVSEKGANALADTVGAVMGILLSDPSQMSKLFGTIAKACGASKATIEKAERWGQIVGLVVVFGANLAMTWGAGAANAVTKAASSATGTVGSAASTIASRVSSALKDFMRLIEPYVSKLIQLLRESLPQLNEVSAVFKEAMLAAKGGVTGSLKGATTSILENGANLYSKAQVGARMGQTAVTGANGLMTGSNGWRDFELAGAQYGIDTAMVDRRKTEQLLSVNRDQIEEADEYTNLALNGIAQSQKANTNLIKEYTRGMAERAAIQVEQMTA